MVWNLVYYFYEYALPVEFILPYELDKDEDAAVAAYGKDKKRANILKVNTLSI